MTPHPTDRHEPPADTPAPSRSASPDTDPAGERFFAELAASLASGQFERLSLGKYRGNEAGLERVLARRVSLKSGEALSLVFRHATKDITRNVPLAQAEPELRALLAAGFRSAHLATHSGQWQLDFTQRGRGSLHHQPAGTSAEAQAGPGDAPGGAARPPATAHNRSKQRWIEPSRPFLAELGVTGADGSVVPAMARKWKQINKFVEVFAHALEDAGLAGAQACAPEANTPLRVADFGCGKGYLTFAVHDYLTQTLARPAQVHGVEIRPELVEFCNGVVARLGLQGLVFEPGDISRWGGTTLDVMIALHACDTATDYAIHMGMRHQARVILCAPCCHKQLRPQMHSPTVLRPLLRHGIHMGQEAEMLTDSLRAMLLESQGYEARVFEFVSLEHTSKNKMILAVKRPSARLHPERLQEVAAVKDFYGIREQCLETLLTRENPPTTALAQIATFKQGLADR